MSKLIFILFLFFCSLHAFSQVSLPSAKKINVDSSNKLDELKEEIIDIEGVKDPNEKDSITTCNDNPCDVLTIKVSDLINELMFKKLLANV